MAIKEDQFREKINGGFFKKKLKQGNKRKFEKSKIRVDLRSPPRDQRGILIKYMGTSALIIFFVTNKCGDERQKKESSKGEQHENSREEKGEEVVCRESYFQKV